MNRRAQALFFVFWILAALAVLAVGIGHSVAVALKASLYQGQRLRAAYAARAGLQRAIVEIMLDETPLYDCWQDSWAENEAVFREVTPAGTRDWAEVGYDASARSSGRRVFGVLDEERKININLAPKELLITLLGACNIKEAEALAEYICAWRGDSGATVPDYGSYGYRNKQAYFTRPQELVLVFGFDAQAYKDVRDFITVYGNGRVNINTASLDVCGMLVDYGTQMSGQELSASEREALLERIARLREEKAVFGSFGEFSEALGLLSSAQQAVLKEMEAVSTVASSCFFINSTGFCEGKRYRYPLQAVFDRTAKKIVYWHEGYAR